MNGKPKIVLATGGTGGHIFPAESLASILAEKGYDPVIISDKRFKEYSGNLIKYEIHVINSATVKPGLIGKIRTIYDIFTGCIQAVVLLRKINPVVVVGFGGYPSYPTVKAATLCKIKTVIHEQNSVLGKANKILAPRAYAIATSFPNVKEIREDDSDKVTLVGNPVRSAIKALYDTKYPEISENGSITILVTGGSQGASIFAKVVPAAVKLLPENLRKRIRIDQQCRKEDLDAVKKTYEVLNVSANLASFFTDIPARLSLAHLVICRAGASTVAELAVAGRPAIMVPYKHASDNHQMSNAFYIESGKGGWIIPEDSFTPEELAKRLITMIENPATLVETAASVRTIARPCADKNLFELVNKIASAVHQKNLR